MNEDSCKIVSLSANNVMKLRAVLIKPDGAVITLKGENGAGKSSVLNAIMFALGGKDAVAAQPIRKGQSRAETVVKLSNGLIVTRRFSDGGTTLTVTTADGTPQRTPQGILDYLVGNLAFDPLAFSRMERDKQFKTLQQLVGLDFTKQDAEKRKLYDDRTVVNRKVDSAKNRLAALTFDEAAPKEKVSVSALVAQKSAVDERNQQNASKRLEVTYTTGRVNTTEATLKALKSQLEDLQKKVDAASKDVSDARAEKINAESAVADLKDEDTSTIVSQINNAETINSKVDANAQYITIKDEFDDANLESEELTQKIDKIEAQKQQALQDAKFPLKELSFNDAGVVFNGLPFDQASDGEKLKASVAVGMALNPKLRVIFVRDGSLLDNNGLNTIASLAKENDYQVWLEDARSTDPTAIEIVDGAVKEVE